jgi:acyl-CoA synthetase (AMP-forming)/AMP-acid ligase II
MKVMKRISVFAFLSLLFAFVFCTGALAQESVPESYEVSDTAYTIYTAEQYKEVIVGVYEGTLPNKTIVLGCDISVSYDLYMEKPCDITIDLNGMTYTNNYRPVKTGDFDLRHKDAIIRIKNGNMDSNFCVFVFQPNSNSEYNNVDNMGQIYLENVNISCAEEVIYNYGGHGGVISFKNCNLDVRGDYSTMGLNNCNTNQGMLYQIDGGTYDGLCIHCALPGSYVRNCTVYARELFIDSWHAHGENGADVQVELSNVQVETQLRLNDARVDPVLYDCTYPKVVLGSNQLIVAYTSPSCERDGTKTDYKGSATGVLDQSYVAPALGHLIDNIKAYILDDEFRRVPIGAVGELYLSGTQIAEGYLNRQEEQIANLHKNEDIKLPEDFDYTTLKGLRIEAIQKLNKFKPLNIGQASRISGVSPADIAVLTVYMKLKERKQ